MKKQTSDQEYRIPLDQFRALLFDVVIPIEALEDISGKPVNDILTYWRKKELIPFIPSGKHTFEVSLADIMWIRILEILRGFSYPIEMMKKVTDYFFTDAYYDELPKNNFLYNKEQLEKKAETGRITASEKKTLQFINESLEDKSFMHSLRYEINYFTNLITDSLASGDPKAILIFMDGRVAEKHWKDYYTHSSFKVNADEPHIRISLVHLFSEFVEKEDLEKRFQLYTGPIKKVIQTAKKDKAA